MGDETHRLQNGQFAFRNMINIHNIEQQELTKRIDAVVFPISDSGYQVCLCFVKLLVFESIIDMSQNAL